jgi:hypothetical protein
MTIRVVPARLDWLPALAESDAAFGERFGAPVEPGWIGFDSERSTDPRFLSDWSTRFPGRSGRRSGSARRLRSSAGGLATLLRRGNGAPVPASTFAQLRAGAVLGKGGGNQDLLTICDVFCLVRGTISWRWGESNPHDCLAGLTAAAVTTSLTIRNGGESERSRCARDAKRS